MATVNDYLGSVKPWHDLHCKDIIDGMYVEDEPRCVAGLAAAWEQLRSDQQLSADERRTMEYMLHNLEFQVINRFYEDEEQGAQFARSYPAIVSLPPVGPLSDSVQAKVQLGMLGAGVRRGFINMTEAEVDALMARIPDEYKTPNIWFYVVVWAFLANNLKYLELALEYQTVTTTGWLDDYYWQRTNLMYQLVSGKATKLDIVKTLKGYDHPHAIEDFGVLFVPRCEALGLMDDELRELHARRLVELEALRGVYPARNPTVTRAVKQH